MDESFSESEPLQAGSLLPGDLDTLLGYGYIQPPVMSPFITFKDGDRYYIMQRGFPHYMGEIIRSGPHSMLSGTDLIQVTGYYIFIRFAGALDGNKVLLQANWRQHIERTVLAMANFYLLARIGENEKGFKKWKIE